MLEASVARQLIEVVVVARIKGLGPLADTHHPCGELGALAGIGHRLGKARREDIEVPRGIRPDHLVVLALEATCRVADPISLDDLGRAKAAVGEDSHMAGVRVLRPLQLTALVGTALGSSVLGLHEVFIALLDPLARDIAIALPLRIYIRPILTEAHGDDPSIDLALVRLQAAERDELARTEEVLGRQLVVLRLGLGLCI